MFYSFSLKEGLLVQQQYYNQRIYGASFSISYLFYYDTMINSIYKYQMTTNENITTFTIDSSENTLYWISDQGISSISTDLSTNYVHYTLDSSMNYNPLYYNQTLAYSTKSGNKYLVWCCDNDIYNIELSGNNGNVTKVYLSNNKNIDGVIIENNIIYYFCVQQASYEVYTTDISENFILHHANTIDGTTYTYPYDGTSQQKPINLTYKNGDCYLTYCFLSSNTINNNEFYIDKFKLSDNPPQSTIIHVYIQGGNDYYFLHPTGLPIDDNGDIYVVPIFTGEMYKSTTEIVCFNKGTKILCMNESNELPPPPVKLSPFHKPQTQIVPRKKDEYIPIEKLKKGDFVKTYKHGYRKISKIITGSFRNNPKKWNMCMYKMTKTDTNGLLEDLIVTGGHSILVDSISETEQAKYDAMDLTEFSKETIDNKRLVLSSVSDQFTAMQDNDMYTYYHLLLENNDDDEERFGIWANGILTETPNVKYTTNH
jgi:hypothetical protein